MRAKENLFKQEGNKKKLFLGKHKMSMYTHNTHTHLSIFVRMYVQHIVQIVHCAPDNSIL